MKNKPYFLALNRIPQVGSRTIQKLITHFPDLSKVFELSITELQQCGLSYSVAQAIHAFDMVNIEGDLRWEQIPGHHILTIESEAYPALLKEIHTPPAVLYLQGELAALGKMPALGIVGSRKPSFGGKETAFRFAHELASQGVTIVSGLALGIDTQAHEGCLQAKGTTIAVMATGMDSIYPRQNYHLAKKISNENGLLISEFPLGSLPTSRHFPQRNRIISGLSIATLVVEAAMKSGSLVTAKHALEQNRDVFAVPGSILNPQVRGCHYLLQQGAKLITSTHDILEELNLTSERNTKHITPIPVASEYKTLLNCVGFEITDIDQIIKRSRLDIEEIRCGLTALELQGLIHSVPGGYIRGSHERQFI